MIVVTTEKVSGYRVTQVKGQVSGLGLISLTNHASRNIEVHTQVLTAAIRDWSITFSACS
jgi:uncharacterized protein YbjQ (UPF0145 family)